MENRPVLWTDPVNWMGRTLPLSPHFRHRYLDETDDAYLAEFFR